MSRRLSTYLIHGEVFVIMNELKMAFLFVNDVYHAVGSLTITDEGAFFRGDDYKISIPKESVTGLEYGPRGKDTFNQWITFEYTDEDGNPKVAQFMDGRLLGWMEAFGGNLRILKVVSQVWSLNHNPQDDGISCAGCWLH